tara:strand:+ start:865 stop:1089 length:225 start_codon:yes stop_codon:yes gene_type:complete
MVASLTAAMAANPEPRNSKALPLAPTDFIDSAAAAPLHIDLYYSPANYCKVDPAADPNTQLNQCKKQRKGWLKI